MLLAVVMLVLGQPLAGPAVKLSGRSGIVQHEMSGRVIRPEKTIEQAVVEKLELSAAVREKVDRVLAERAAAIDRFVTENLVLLGQAETVGAAGSLMDKIVFGADLVRRLGEAIGGKSLKESIVAVLPRDQAARFSAMWREYWRALHEEGKELKPKDPPPAWAVYLGESGASLGREIAKSFERQQASGTVFVDYLLSGVELTEAQRQIVRDLKVDLMERTNMKASEEDQGNLALSVAAYLNQDQRAIVIERVAGVVKKKK